MHTWCCPICTSNQPLPFVANNPAQQPAVAGAPPLQPPPTVTPTPLPTNITQSNYRHHNINVLQYNIDGLNLKHSQLKDYMSKNNIHIAMLQETKIKPHHVQSVDIENYSHIRKDRVGQQGGGLITYIHHSINYSDTSAQTQALVPSHDTHSEVQSIKVSTGKKKYINLINIYLPPDNYTIDLEELAQKPNVIICGDFNAKHTDWYTGNPSDHTRGIAIQHQFNNLTILNDINTHTHIPYQANRSFTSPDITFCSSSIAIATTWRADEQLGSDHKPIVITTQCRDLNQKRTTFINYKGADWNGFTQTTEENFSILNTTDITNIDVTLKRFNTIITNADRQYIPRGCRRTHNPNFTREIKDLMRERDRLKHRSPRPHTEYVSSRIRVLNKTITEKVQERKTNNWNSFVDTLDYRTGSKKLFKTIKSITVSSNGSSTSHAAVTKDENIPSRREQSNILIKHYANTSTVPRTREDRRVFRRVKNLPLDHEASPFSNSQTKHIVINLKNSQAAGPDQISNYHLKHLGPQGIQALTRIANYSYNYSKIPELWKRGKIVTQLKPNKDATNPASHRPITLLCTAAKVIERLMHNLINPHITLSTTQHGFRPMHSTNTLLTQLTQDVTDGFNERAPHERTVLVTLDISRAFDGIPRYGLINKILSTTMPDNSKRWLANYLSGRSARVSFQNCLSKTRIIPNGVPQGSVLSPTLFNLYMHDMPMPHRDSIKLATYADDITITSKHKRKEQATTEMQTYLDTLQMWFEDNRLKVAPTKSTVTLMTGYTHEHDYVPHLTLANETIPFKRSTKILGVTYDTAMTFRDHAADVRMRCRSRLNALKTIAGADFGSKETSSMVYKQSIRSVMEYANTAWSSCIADTNLKALEVIETQSLRSITGCVKSTRKDHLYQETKIVPLAKHLKMRGAQFIAKAHNIAEHPLHYFAEGTLPPRIQKQSPNTMYSGILSEIPPPSPPATELSNGHIHTHLTRQAISSMANNTVLGMQPPAVDIAESTLCRRDRVHLARLRCGHHPALQVYKHRIDPQRDHTCPLCRSAPQTTRHVMEECQTLQQLRAQLNITGVLDLWSSPLKAIAYVHRSGILGPA